VTALPLIRSIVLFGDIAFIASCPSARKWMPQPDEIRPAKCETGHISGHLVRWHILIIPKVTDAATSAADNDLSRPTASSNSI